MSFSCLNIATRVMRDGATQLTTGLSLLYPLDEFYEQSGLSLPSVIRVEGQDMPEPYKNLLVHENDMTPTLERAYDRKIFLRVLKYSLSDDVFSRQVVLLTERETSAVEFGAIKIHLKHFPPHARELILERKQPLGTILHGEAIKHSSRPEAYFQITSDPIINNALHLKGSCVLYGRQNVLLNSSRQTLAQVVEILPPSDGFFLLEQHRAQS